MKNPTRCNSVSTFLLFLILNEAQHISGDTPPIIRSLKLHWQPPFLHTWKAVRRAVVGRYQVALYATWQSPTTARATTFHLCKTRGCLCSLRLLMMGGVSPETCWASFKIRNNKNFETLLHLVGFFIVRIVLWCNDPWISTANNSFMYFIVLAWRWHSEVEKFFQTKEMTADYFPRYFTKHNGMRRVKKIKSLLNSYRQKKFI